MSFSDDVRDLGPHDHITNPPPKSPLMRALDSINLADENLKRFPDDAEVWIEWFQARRRWEAAVREAMK